MIGVGARGLLAAGWRSPEVAGRSSQRSQALDVRSLGGTESATLGIQPD